MNKFTKYFRGVNEEAKRIRWPDRKTLWKSVAIVLIISVIAALAIAGSDGLAIQINKAFRIAFPEKNSSSSGAAAAIQWFKGVM